MDQPVSWLPDPSLASLRAALGEVDADLGGRPMVARQKPVTSDARFFQGTARVDRAVLVKFAWAEVPARRIVHEAAVLHALAGTPLAPWVPKVVLASTQPALLGTRWVPGPPLAPSDVTELGGTRRRRLVADLASFLAALHHGDTLATMRRTGIGLRPPEPQADTDQLRARFGALVDRSRASRVAGWCDWVDAVLARPVPEQVFLHADLHGFNLVWEPPTGHLSLVADWETAAAGDPAYDFRALPAWTAASVDFFVELAAAYVQSHGQPVDNDRVMAWHVRTALGDALWRTEAGVALPGGGTASTWVDDVAHRMRSLGCG